MTAAQTLSSLAPIPLTASLNGLYDQLSLSSFIDTISPRCFQHRRVFSNEVDRHCTSGVNCQFSFSIDYSATLPDLVSFGMDWLDHPFHDPKDSQSFSTFTVQRISYLAENFLYSQISHPYKYRENHYVFDGPLCHINVSTF